MKIKNKKCKECESPHVVNSFFSLCQKCNNNRLYGNEFGKMYDSVKRPTGFKNKPKNNIKGGLSDKAKNTIKKDEELYEKVFSCSDHRCENCGAQLNIDFRDNEGRVIARWRYAHLIAKSIAPKLRHTVENVVNLCLECHQQLDFGDKEKMINWKYIESRIKKLRDEA